LNYDLSVVNHSVLVSASRLNESQLERALLSFQSIIGDGLVKCSKIEGLATEKVA